MHLSWPPLLVGRQEIQPATRLKTLDVVDIDVRDLERFAVDQQNFPESELAGQQALAHRFRLRRTLFWRPRQGQQIRVRNRLGKDGDLRGARIDRGGMRMKETRSASAVTCCCGRAIVCGPRRCSNVPRATGCCFAIHIDRVVFKTLQQRTRGAGVIDDLSGFDRLVPLQLKRAVLCIAARPSRKHRWRKSEGSNPSVASCPRNAGLNSLLAATRAPRPGSRAGCDPSQPPRHGQPLSAQVQRPARAIAGSAMFQRFACQHPPRRRYRGGHLRLFARTRRHLPIITVPRPGDANHMCPTWPQYDGPQKLDHPLR